MTGIKDKTVHGLFWSSLNNLFKLGTGFLIGIILARLLTPHDFGLIGMVTIFAAVSQTIIDSGFSQALIRKKECTQADYSTIFFFNLTVGIIIYILLFLSAGLISNFFHEPQLKQIIPVIGLSIIINALGLIQTTILTKKLDFKVLTKISIISSVISGIIGITMAYSDYGVWSLVLRGISASFIGVVLLWIWNKWVPSRIFNYRSFREMFSFGSKLLLSGIIDKVYNNIYLLIIGKYFSAVDLGYYTRANMFQRLPSENITRDIQRVSYPVLSSLRDDKARLKHGFRKLIKSTMFITFVLMIGMAAVAKPMILTLIGEKWEQSIIYLQMLCFAGMLYPLHALNLNMLQVQGRSDLFLKLEVIKKGLAVPVIIIGIMWGIKVMIIGIVFLSFIAYYINSYWSGQLIGYSVREQISDIFPSFLLAGVMGIIVFTEGIFISCTSFYLLMIQLATGALLIFGICEVIQFKDYLVIKSIVVDKLFKHGSQ